MSVKSSDACDAVVADDGVGTLAVLVSRTLGGESWELLDLHVMVLWRLSVGSLSAGSLGDCGFFRFPLVGVELLPLVKDANACARKSCLRLGSNGLSDFGIWVVVERGFPVGVGAAGAALEKSVFVRQVYLASFIGAEVLPAGILLNTGDTFSPC
jgi:hypothetical protein